MLIRHLTIDGIGPFGKRHEIDFDALTSGGIFLLDGPTGSGKSSIIDAIVFALYGDVAGENSDKSRVRSTHANVDQPSEVRLVFTVASGTYCIIRQPKWDKPKRGGGTTERPATVKLIRLPEGAVENQQWDRGEDMGAKAQVVGPALAEILTLTRKQFIQTVVLPQGQFAEFLRMSSEDRSKLLETLFATGDYRGLARRLNDASARAVKGIDRARAGLDSAIAVWSADDAVEEWREELSGLTAKLFEPDDSRIIELMTSAGEALAERATTAGVAEATARNKLDRANSQLAATERVVKAIADKQRFTTELTELEATRETVDTERERIERHQQAAVPANLLDTLDRTHQRLSEAAGELTRGDLDVDDVADLRLLDRPAELDDSTLRTIATDVDAKLGELDDESESLGATITKLTDLAELESSLTASKAHIDSIDTQIAELKDAKKSFEAALADVPAREEALRKELAGLDEQIASGSALQSDRERLELDKKLFADIDAATAREASAKASLEESLVLLRSAGNDLSSVTARWVNSQAAELATKLEDDAPCPVCGSTEHPHPAEPSDEFASRDDVDAAQEAFNTVASDHERAKEGHTQAASVLNQLIEQRGTMTVESMAEREAALATSLNALEHARARKESLTGEQTALEQTKQEIIASIAASDKDIASLDARKDALASQLERDSARVAEARGDDESITSTLDSVRSARARVQNALKALQSLSTAISSVADARAGASRAIEESSLSEEEIRSSTMRPEELQSARTTVTAFDSKYTELTTLLRSDEITNLTGEEEPDIEGARKTLAEAKEQHLQMSSAATLARKAASDAERNVTAVARARDEWARVSTSAGPLVRLARLANADSISKTKISLAVWVLLRRFEVVLDRANEYLARFSKGRYALARTDEGGRERKFGLGLEVIDYQGSVNGEERREIGTLSGGETFYTSLSLALGLTEVVQEENGGVRIDTLMIDEGFGSLSPDVLDDVMETLTTLASSGRKVGIISHVEELKSVIPNRLTITPVANGSSTIQVQA